MPRLFFPALLALLLLQLLSLAQSPAPSQSSLGVAVAYQLPTDGPLPRTYRVTLAIVDAKNPDWIISQFAAGVARTVTPENGGKFSENWNGLDDNFMPVPPGDYAVKGIYMPARQWEVDSDWHTITPRFAGGASSWQPSPDNWRAPEPFGGDPVGAPFEDVAVGPNGVGVFYYQYLENGLNNPMFDLKKPLGYGQFLRAFPSGGAGGGTSVATDGETVWAFSTDGGPKYVYRADGKPFGKSEGANRRNGYLPDGWVTAMAAWHDPKSGKTLVAVAQRGKIVEFQNRKREYRESETEFADKVTIHEGDGGRIVAELPLSRPRGLAFAQDGTLYALHQGPAVSNQSPAWTVSAVSLAQGAPGEWRRVFNAPSVSPIPHPPTDLEVDSHGRFYVSDTTAGLVAQFDRNGKALRTFGDPAGQAPGRYNPQALMSPAKLATWADPEGRDRLIICEKAGPNRASEWDADTGKLLREFLNLQTKANDGYGFDPEHPEHAYLLGQQGWVTRFRIDYATGQWSVDAVWPCDENEPRAPKLDRPQFFRVNGRMYLACRRSYNVYRLDEQRGRWMLSAAILRERKGNAPSFSFWHDANGNGHVEDEEVTPTEMPAGLLTYHGQRWLEDLSLLAPEQGGRDVWQLTPSGFDTYGNPIFTGWRKVLTDPVFAARAEGKADAVRGGNELAEKFTSDWMGADGSMAQGFYVQARGGKNFSANEGAQHKISRYIPDGHGGFRLLWRTGRSALQGLAQPGEMYGGMRIQRPINGLLSVVDQSRCGVLLYTEEGLYVDTVFPDERRFPQKSAGLYPQPGEFFAGQVFPNRDNGTIYFAMGKFTPLLYAAEGWSLRENPVKPLTSVQRTVNIRAAEIARPPEIALSLRGGAGAAKVARFAPALGDAAFDGSLSGWESCEPVVFQSDKEHTVEARCLYRPDEILLRWHARLAGKFEPKPMPPLERVFSHEQLADTLSFYLQGDPNAKAGGPLQGRPGDARFVFGVFTNKSGAAQPVGVALYPEWNGPGKGQPQVYRTPVGTAAFAHVGPIAGAKLAYKMDEDQKGFVFVAAIPRSAIPRLKQPFAGGLRTLANFEATYGGHNKFWWANSDGSASRETYDEPTEARLYPGSWAPVEFEGLADGVVVRNWLICGPFGGPGAEKFKADPNGVIPGTNKEMKQAVREFCEAAAYPPDSDAVDLDAVYSGDQVRGYWADPRKVKWKPAAIAEMDKRVVLGGGGQTWYGATWIYAPAETDVEFQFQSHPMTALRWFVNGEPAAVKTVEYRSEGDKRTAAKKTLALRAGWNQVTFRGYCAGYPPFRAGLVLNAPQETLWGLKLSGTPPAK